MKKQQDKDEILIRSNQKESFRHGQEELIDGL